MQSYVVSAPACRATALTKNGAERRIKHIFALSSKKSMATSKLYTKKNNNNNKKGKKRKRGGDGKTEYGGVKAM
jgi:hypothetical protein